MKILVQDAFTFRPWQMQATPVFAVADFAAVAAAGTLLPPGWINTTVDGSGEETLCATLLGTARNIDMNPRPR